MGMPKFMILIHAVMKTATNNRRVARQAVDILIHAVMKTATFYAYYNRM